MSSAIELTYHPLAVGGYLAQITLNAPQKSNALCDEMVVALDGVLKELAQDEEAVAVLLDGGGGKSFCAGADARQLQTVA